MREIHLVGVVLASVVFPRATLPAQIYVPGDQPTIQAGIDAAMNGDIVIVAPGIYAGIGNKNLDLHGKTVEIHSEAGAEATVIDCEDDGRAFFLVGLGSGVIIEGFTVRRGDGKGETAGGGAIFIGGGEPTISRCRFEHNGALGMLDFGGGGAIVAYNSAARIVDCEFVKNIVSGTGVPGGAVAAYNSTISIVSSRFMHNSATGFIGAGGAVFIEGINPSLVSTIQDCDIRGNEAHSGGGLFLFRARCTNSSIASNSGQSGGGIAANSVELANCIIIGNTAGINGGGAEVANSTMNDCLIIDNTAERGGGLDWLQDSAINSCLVARNSATIGGGLASHGDGAEIHNCTVAANSATTGSGVYLFSDAPTTWLFSHMIVSGGRGGTAVECAGQADAAFSCSDIYDNEGGDWVGCVSEQLGTDGNISADPRFCDPKADDWHLCEQSPCTPEHSPDCGLIGALDVGCSCPIAIEPSTWGQIKARYQD